MAFAYTAAGQRITAGGDTFTYDARGRLLTEMKAGGEILAYTYDAAGNRTSVTTSAGTTTYTYDALNRLETVTDASGTTTYAYDAVGNVASTSRPNGVTTTYALRHAQPADEPHQPGPGGLVSSYVYTLDDAGKRTQVVESGPATLGRTVTYGYDAVDRLVSETTDGPGTANDRLIQYTYDGSATASRSTRRSA